MTVNINALKGQIKSTLSNEVVRNSEGGTLSAEYLLDLERQLELKYEEIMEILHIDYNNDPNSKETPKRLAKMLVRELFAGRYEQPPAITDFDNTENYDQLITTGPWEVKSVCSHHWMPIYGHCYIGVLPGREGRLIGLSKYPRVIEHFSRRPQIQEGLTRNILNYFREITNSEGLAVRIIATHGCCSHRGVNQVGGLMVTTQLYGELTDDALKQEFLSECHNLQLTHSRRF